MKSALGHPWLISRSPNRERVRTLKPRPPCLPWTPFVAELAGTALLVAVGLSIVIFDFGRGSPMLQLLPNGATRRLITGFLFGTTGALIALSPLGKASGAHINPAVTFAFWLMGRMKAGLASGYVLCQLAGAVLGAIPLLFWGAMGASTDFGATVPGATYGTTLALLGETVATFAMIFGLFAFLRHRGLRRLTPALFPPLYAIMVWIEAPISGTSTNPARSLGPCGDLGRLAWLVDLLAWSSGGRAVGGCRLSHGGMGKASDPRRQDISFRT